MNATKYYIKKEGWEYDELPTYYSILGEWTRNWNGVKVFDTLEEAVDTLIDINDETHLVSIERF